MANKYIQQYNTQADYEAATKEFPNVSLVKGSSKLYYEDDAVDVVIPVDYSKEYLTFVALEDGQFKFVGQNNNVLSYSVDDGSTWTTLSNNTFTPTIAAGSMILWKGNASVRKYFGIGTFSSTANFDVEGNVMSLLYGDDFKGQTNLSGNDYTFYELFKGNINVVSTENLVLPATTLAVQCYRSVFSGCTNLTTAPQLPATTLAESCYDGMFQGCTSLTTAPQLPATTLAYGCYAGMFSHCTSLTTAPQLPATAMTMSCYYAMFSDCTSLTNAPELPAMDLIGGDAGNGGEYEYMFFGCTSLTTAPVLPAPNLKFRCYNHMFDGCSSLNSITCLATDITAGITLWVRGVPANGTFTKAEGVTWPSGDDGIPNGWTVVDAQ